MVRRESGGEESVEEWWRGRVLKESVEGEC